jgi:hypothetical protein
MGFFKDLREVSKAGAEASAGWDPAAQMRLATDQMQRAAAQSRVLAAGTPARATVVELRDTRTTMNQLPLVEVDLLVIPDGGAPWPATAVNVGHAALAGLRPGSSVSVRSDPAEPATVAIV